MTAPTRNEPDTGAGQAREAPVQWLALLGVAALLRAHELASPLWYDEIVTLVEYVRLAPAEILSTYTSSNNHLFYSLLAHGSVGTFGESAWAVRLPAAAFGVASLAAFWWLAHELLPTRQARLASWAVALSYHHVWFSQNARGYTGILFFAWLATALFVRLQRGGGARLWLAYSACLALAAWTHLSALLVFVAHGLVALGEQTVGRYRRGQRLAPMPFAALALGLLGASLLYAPLLPDLAATLLEQRDAGQRGETVASWKNPLWTLLEIARGLPIGTASLAVVSLGAACAAVGLGSLARHRPFDALLLVLPGALTLGALLLAGFNIWPRYFLVSLGFGALLTVHGVFIATRFLLDRAGVDDSPGWTRRVATGLCLLGVAGSAATTLYNYRFPKQDYPSARDFVLEHNTSGAPVRTAGLADLSYGRYYEPGWPALESLEQLEALLDEAPECWVVYSFPVHLAGTKPHLFARLERDFEPVAHFPGTLRDGDVHVLRWTAPAGARP